jgi:hypothetical protein
MFKRLTLVVLALLLCAVTLAPLAFAVTQDSQSTSSTAADSAAR